MGRDVRLLLDTHALLWWLLGDERVPHAVRERVDAEGAEVHVSAVSAMEIATKFRIGKLPQAEPIAGRLGEIVADRGFLPMPITLPHGDLAGSLQHRHGDPFDRLLIAQALIEQATLVSNEALFDAFGVRRLW